MLNIFITQPLDTYILRQELSLIPELAHLVRLAGQQALGFPCLCLPSAGLTQVGHTTSLSHGLTAVKELPYPSSIAPWGDIGTHLTAPITGISLEQPLNSGLR